MTRKIEHGAVWLADLNPRQVTELNRTIRLIIDVATNPIFSTRHFRAVPANYRTLIPEYVKD